MYDILPGALRIFRSACPMIHLNLEDMSSGQQIEALYGRKIDIGFVRPPVQETLFDVENVVTEELMVALPENHQFRQRREVGFADLAEEPFLACPRKLEPGLYELCLGLTRQAGFQARVVQEAAHIQTLMGLVAAGVGICLVPSSATRLHRTGVIYRPISVPRVRIQKLLVWRKDPGPSPIAPFLEAVRQAATLLRTSQDIRDACLTPQRTVWITSQKAIQEKDVSPTSSAPALERPGI